MKFNLKYFAVLAATAALILLGCGKNGKAQKPVKEVAVKVVKPVAVEKVKPEEPKGPVQDRHFIFIDMATEGLKTGSVLEASVDAQIPFDNPFDSRNVYVEAYINGEKNGVSLNVPMYYVSGDSEKSTWRLAFPLTKAGAYKCSFTLRAKNRSYVSLEYPFEVAEGGKSPYLKISKKARACFKNGEGEKFRALGGNMDIRLDDSARDALLDKLQNAGANTVRISLEAPRVLFVPEDTETAKAGWLDMPSIAKIESFMNAASKRGIRTVISFASPLSFKPDVYAGSYFAKSGIAKTPKEFFSSFEAQQCYSRMLSYMGARFGARTDLLMWEMFNGLDAFDMPNFDLRMNWLSTLTVAMRDADIFAGHPLMLSAGTSSEFDFIWSGDSCSVIMFDLYDVADFAHSVNSHNRFFTRRYKKPSGISSFGKTNGRIALPEPSNSFVHNAMWSGLFTAAPVLPLADLTDAMLLDANIKAISEVAAFSKKFDIGDESLENGYAGDLVISSSKKNAENAIYFHPAFGETVVERETSNDIAELVMAADGTVYKNTVSRVWKNGAIVTFKIRGVPDDKCAFSFDVVSLPVDSLAKLAITLNDEEIAPQEFKPGDAKTVRSENGTAKSFLNKTVTVPLQSGDQVVTIQIEGANAALDVANFRVTGMGSNRGFASVRAYSIRSKEDGNRFFWFKRAGTDSATVAKFKLYERDIPELKSFEYPVRLENKGGKDFKVTWWDTRANSVIAEGVLKCGADSILNLRVPSFKFDIACFVSQIK